MDRLKSMQIFTEVANSGSFTGAADKLGLSRAQVSKSVMQLEAHLDTRLLHRTTRKISLTETGQIYLERSEAILKDIDEIEGITRQQSTEPQGKLTLSTPTSFGILHLNNALPDYMTQYPEVQLSLNLTDRAVDVVSEGFDLAIRIGELEDSSLVARRIAPCKRVYCATPKYLETHGIPKVPQDLTLHSCLAYANDFKPDRWTLAGPNGEETVSVSGPLCADNGDALRASALAGLGITLLPTFIVGTDLSSGKLVEVLEDYCPPEISIYAVYPSRRYLSAKVRTFIDFLIEQFGETPDWDRYQ